MDNQIYAVIGGDARQGYLAALLADEGCTVFTAGLDRLPDKIATGSVRTNAYTAAAMAEVVLLPVMPTGDGATLSAPFSSEDIPLDERLCDSLRHTRVYTGYADRLRGISKKYSELDLYDYSGRETFLIKNAQITAEAALMLAIERMPKALYESRCLVTGFGRIGRALASLLRSTGAAVSVAARKPEDFARIESAGMRGAIYSRLPFEASRYDLVVNTADALVLGEAFIRGMQKDALIIDVASRPGGTDFDAARQHGIETLHALGLPGKYAPKTAARIIIDTVTELMEEEKH